MVAGENIHGFVGRKRELTELNQILESGQTSLVTIVGTGGVGKTRLAREVVGRAKVDAVWVSLSSITESSRVPLAIALACDSQIPDTADPWSVLTSLLAGMPRLLVLDNLEQIAALADPLANMLAQRPNVRVLATSRIALGVANEHVMTLAPLSLTAEANDISLAAHLFIRSAQHIRADFSPTADDLEAIEQLCHRLDGLPLSIEIAAAQMRVMSPRDILASLTEYPHHVLQLPARGHTLEATIARSYDLIEPDARQLFRRFALAPAGITPAFAAALIDHSERVEVLLNRLVDHHMISRDDTGRYRMLETIRVYAEKALGTDPGADIARQRLAEVIGHQALAAGERRDYLDGRSLLDAVNLEWDTIRSLMSTLIASQPEAATSLLIALEQVVFARGHVAEAWGWANALLILPIAATNAALTLMAGRLARIQGLLSQADLLVDASRTLDDSPAHRAWVNYEYGTLRRNQGRFDDARAYLLRADTEFGDIGNLAAQMKVRNGLGCVEMDLHNWSDSARWFESGLELAQSTGAILDESRINLNRGYLATLQNDFETAVRLHEANITLCENVGDIGNLAMNYVNLAGALIGLQRWADAEQYELLAVPLLRTLGNLAGETFTLSGRVAIARGRGEYVRERELLGELMALRQQLGMEIISAQLQLVRNWHESGEHDRADAELEGISVSEQTRAFHHALGDWYRGAPRGEQQLRRALLAIDDQAELEFTIDFLTESLGIDPPADTTPPGLQRLPLPARRTHGVPLTSREQEVLALIAAGRTDRQIAEEIFVTPRTVGFHVSNILRKLDLGSRAEAAAWAARNMT